MTGSPELQGLQKSYRAKLGDSRAKANKALTTVAVPKKPKASTRAKPSTASSTGASGGEETGATGEEGASTNGGGEGASADSVGDAAGETPADGAQDDDSGAQGGGAQATMPARKQLRRPGRKMEWGLRQRVKLLWKC